jgi:hypothetical protein
MSQALELLQFVLRDFWTFAGSVVLLAIVCQAPISLLVAILTAMRSR